MVRKFSLSKLLIVFLTLCVFAPAYGAESDYKVKNGDVYAHDFIGKGPEVDVRAYMDGKSSRPTYATWRDNQATTDITSSIQSAIDSGASAVFATDGIYSITGINITGKNNFHFYCKGKCELRWAGAADVPMLLLKNNYRPTIEGFRFNNTTANQPSACIESNIEAATIPASVPVVTGNVFKDLVLGGDSANSVKRPVYYTYTGSDQNNEYGAFYNVTAQNYSVAGFEINQTESMGHHFYNCFASGGPIGIYARYGAFSWYGGGFNANTTADVVIDTVFDPVNIYDVRSENSKRFLTAATPVGTIVTIKGISWANNALHADGNMIDMHGGKLILIGNTFGSFNTGIPKVYAHNNSGFPMTVTSQNNMWLVYQSTDPPPSPFTTDAYVTLFESGDTMSVADQTPRLIGESVNLSGNLSVVGNIKFSGLGAGKIPYYSSSGLLDSSLSVSGDNTGVDVASPTARLHLPAGTATAGTAPPQD